MKNWFGKNPESAGAPSSRGDRYAGPPRPLNGLDHDLAVGFLTQANSILPISERDALTITGYLTSRQFDPAETIFPDSDADTGYMLWILHGEITVETTAFEPGIGITVTVLEPGRTLGEMGFMEGNGRSVDCTACSDVRCAQLTRAAFKALSTAHPQVAAKLATLIAMNLSSRLRDLTEKFKRHVAMSNLMRAKQYLEATPQVASDAG